MKYSQTRILILALAALALGGLLFGSRGLAHRTVAQDQAKSMAIERYPNEPLELVDLRIGSNSIQSAIETRVSKNAAGFDNVKFNAPPDWHKSVSLTVKNVSGKPVIGVMAHLFFKAAGSGDMFQMQLFQQQDLRKEALAPGAEINLEVKPRVWENITNMIKQRGADPDRAAVSLSVDAVMFTEDSQWYRGSMVRRDPGSPNTWRNVDPGDGSHQ